MIAVICDGCGTQHPQAGPNNSSVTIPDGWVQIAIEKKQTATLVQHQCPKCFKVTQDLLREHAQRNMPDVTNHIGAPLPGGGHRGGKLGP